MVHSRKQGEPKPTVGEEREKVGIGGRRQRVPVDANGVRV